MLILTTPHQDNNHAMEEPRTPYDFKELFVELSARRYMGDSMSEALSPNNLAAMSMMDASCMGNLETSLYSGPDLFTSLRHEISSSSREKWIELLLLSAIGDETFANEINRFLDEDLKVAGKEDLIRSGFTLSHKARVIASYRIRKNILLMHQPSHSVGAENTSTFKVILRSLVGGHGGNRRDNLLYFNYSTSFPLFQIILRDATKLSTIPPIEFEQQACVKKAKSPDAGSEKPSQTSSIHCGRNIQQRRNDKSSDGGSYQSSEISIRSSLSTILGSKDIFEQQGRAKPRTANSRGYTIDDGPWLYYLGHKGHAWSRDYNEIKDEDSYLKMVEQIREASRKDAHINYFALLFHSMDKEASDKWSLLRDEESEAEKQFQNACLNGEISGVSIKVHDDNDEVDEDEIGEPYLQWMAKNMARPKRE